MDLISRECGRPSSELRPAAVTARISQRWAIDLSPGTADRPRSERPGRTLIFIDGLREPDRIEARARQHLGGIVRRRGRNGQVHGPAPALRRVNDLEVLDVHPSVREDRGQFREGARAVGCFHLQHGNAGPHLGLGRKPEASLLRLGERGSASPRLSTTSSRRSRRRSM